MKSAAHLTIVTMALVAFLVNPSFGCLGADDEYDYDADDVQAAILGTWRVVMPEGEALLVLVSAPAPNTSAAGSAIIQSAFACGNRTLYKAASACISSSSLPLKGEISGLDAPGTTSQVEGEFRVDSLVFTQGHLDLKLVDGNRISGDYRGRLLDNFEGTLWGPGGADLGRLTFARVK